MEIKPIEVKAYHQMKQAFEKFAKEIEGLCSDLSIEKEWLDNDDVCHYLHIQPRTLNMYRKYRTIPFSMIRGKCYYKTSDVQKLIDNSKSK